MLKQIIQIIRKCKLLVEKSILFESVSENRITALV